MHGVTVDGNDPLEVYKVVKEARERAVRGEGPTLVETLVHRLTPHSSDDDDRSYRTKEEIEEAKKKDPIYTFASYLKEIGLLTEELEQNMQTKIASVIDEATDYAENAPYAAPEHALKHVYGN